MIIDHTLTGELHSRYNSDTDQVEMHTIDSSGCMFSTCFSRSQLIAHIATLKRLAEAFDEARGDRDVARWIAWAEEHSGHPLLRDWLASRVPINNAPHARPDSVLLDGERPGSLLDIGIPAEGDRRLADGDWEASGPEEGDTCDLTVLVCNHQTERYEVIEIRSGTTDEKKLIARSIAALLNRGAARLVV